MTDARTEILSRIRAALGDEADAGPGAVPGAVPRGYRSAGEHAPGSDVVQDLLVDRLVDYKAHVHRVPAAELPALLARLVAESSAGPRSTGPGSPRSTASTCSPTRATHPSPLPSWTGWAPS
jgi:L-lactate dehydrogenase complex protein LldG